MADNLHIIPRPKSKTLVILLGRKDSGKGTIAEILLDKLRKCGVSVSEKALADHLKKSLALLFGWDPEMLKGTTPESRKWREEPDPVWSKRLGKNIIPRNMMVRFGTTMVRNHIDDKFWMVFLEEEILKSKDDVIIISDGRLISEYMFFLGGFTNVIILSITSDRAIAPYEDKLRKFIQDKHHSVDEVRHFLDWNGVFNDEAEISEWETTLLQLTDLKYLDPGQFGPKQSIVYIMNNTTKAELADSLDIVTGIIINLSNS